MPCVPPCPCSPRPRTAAELLLLLDDIESYDLSQVPHYVPLLVRELRKRLVAEVMTQKAVA